MPATIRKAGARNTWPKIATIGATRLAGAWEGIEREVRKVTTARTTDIHHGNLLAMIMTSSMGLVRGIRAMGLCGTPDGEIVNTQLAHRSALIKQNQHPALGTQSRKGARKERLTGINGMKGITARAGGSTFVVLKLLAGLEAQPSRF